MRTLSGLLKVLLHFKQRTLPGTDGSTAMTHTSLCGRHLGIKYRYIPDEYRGLPKLRSRPALDPSFRHFLPVRKRDEWLIRFDIKRMAGLLRFGCAKAHHADIDLLEDFADRLGPSK